jgi:hypothetical protein
MSCTEWEETATQQLTETVLQAHQNPIFQSIKYLFFTSTENINKVKSKGIPVTGRAGP